MLTNPAFPHAPLSPIAQPVLRPGTIARCKWRLVDLYSIRPTMPRVENNASRTGCPTTEMASRVSSAHPTRHVHDTWRKAAAENPRLRPAGCARSKTELGFRSGKEQLWQWRASSARAPRLRGVGACRRVQARIAEFVPAG